MTSRTDNHTFITQGFQILRQAMASYIARKLRAAYGNSWWQTAVYDKLYDDQKRNLPSRGSDEELANELDIALCLLLLDLYWTQVFRLHLPQDCRTWANGTDRRAQSMGPCRQGRIQRRRHLALSRQHVSSVRLS